MGSIREKLDRLFNDKSFSDILTGSAWAVIGSTIGMVFTFLVSFIVARKYGAEAVGIVAVINSFLGITTLITVLGTNTSILRLIPEYMVKYSPTSAFRLFQRTELLIIISSIIIGVICYFLSGVLAEVIFSKPYLRYYLELASVFIIFKSMALLNTEAIRGLKLKKIYAFMQFFPKSMNLLLLFILVFFFTDDHVPVFALLGESLLTAGAGIIIVWRVFRSKIRFDDVVKSLSVKRILSISIPMLVGQASFFLMGNLGVLLLGVYRSEEEVGFFSIALSLSILTSFSIKAVNSVAAPNFSELFHSNKIDEMFHVARKSAKLIFWTTLPIISILVLGGKYLIGFVYGDIFQTAYISLVLLSIGQFVNAVSGATGTILNMTGNEGILRNIMFCATILNVILNLLLIPKFGINGAAFSTFVTIVFWNLLSLKYIHIKFGRTTGYLPFIK